MQQPTAVDTQEQVYHKEGYLDLPWIQSLVPAVDGSFYFCGPVPFMKTVNQSLIAWGVAEADRHYEFFGPAGSAFINTDIIGEKPSRSFSLFPVAADSPFLGEAR